MEAGVVLELLESLPQVVQERDLLVNGAAC